MQDYKITLLNGTEINGILKSEQPAKLKSDNLKLDTIGEYLSVGNRKPIILKKDIIQRATEQYNRYLFTENAWFLHSSAEKIFSDSRMFLAPIKIQNGLAYTGTSGFWRPTLGVYLEWWLNFKGTSTDKNGNLVWYISGSPLSGSNCCSSVNPNGEQVKMSQRTSFSAIWRSFMEVNNRYNEAKQKCDAYSLEEVLIKLHGEDYKYRIIELKHEMIEKVMGWDKSLLEKTCFNLRAKMERLVKANRKIQLRQHRDSILAFHKGYLERQTIVKELEKGYVAKHKDLKKQLHDGTLEGDYHLLLAEASKDYRLKKREQSESINRFIAETFGSNPNHITPMDVTRYASGKPLNFKINL